MLLQNPRVCSLRAKLVVFEGKRMIATRANLYPRSSTDSDSVRDVGARLWAKCLIARKLSDKILCNLSQTPTTPNKIQERRSRE